MNVQIGVGPTGLGAALLTPAHGGARHCHRSPEAVPAVPAKSPGVMHSTYVDCLCLLAVKSMIVFPFPGSNDSLTLGRLTAVKQEAACPVCAFSHHTGALSVRGQSRTPFSS